MRSPESCDTIIYKYFGLTKHFLLVKLLMGALVLIGRAQSCYTPRLISRSRIILFVVRDTQSLECNLSCSLPVRPSPLRTRAFRWSNRTHSSAGTFTLIVSITDLEQVLRNPVKIRVFFSFSTTETITESLMNWFPITKTAKPFKPSPVPLAKALPGK